MLGFDAYAGSVPGCDDVLAGAAAAAHAAGPAHAAADHAGGRGAAAASGARARRAAADASCRRTPSRCCAAGSAPGRSPPLKLASRLRPAVRVLRDPVVPRRVRLPAAGRGAGRGGVAGRARASASWCWSARTPPPTARTWATCGCWSGCCRSWPRSPGIVRVRVSYLQPAETRPVADRDDRHHARRGALLRPVLPARQRAGAAPDAPVRRRPSGSSACWRRSGRWRRRQAYVSNVIVGFPGETRADVAELERFLSAARLDAIGVFGY